MCVLWYLNFLIAGTEKYMIIFIVRCNFVVGYFWVNSVPNSPWGFCAWSLDQRSFQIHCASQTCEFVHNFYTIISSFVLSCSDLYYIIFVVITNSPSIGSLFTSNFHLLYPKITVSSAIPLQNAAQSFADLPSWGEVNFQMFESQQELGLLSSLIRNLLILL